jgi:hypothetical protein
LEHDRAVLEEERAEKKETELARVREKEVQETRKAALLKRNKWRKVPDDIEDRVLFALDLIAVAEEERIKLTKVEVQAHCGIGKKKLDLAIKNKEAGGSGLVPMGCPPRMSDDQAEQVYRIVTERGMKWDAVMVKDGGNDGAFEDVCLEVLRAGQTNQLCELRRPAPSTVEVWRKQCRCIDRSGSKKNDGRQRALLDVRSGISFAAALTFLFTVGGVHYSHFFSSDAVSVLINPWDGKSKPRVMLTQEVIDFHKEHNISAGYSSSRYNVNKQRVMEVTLTISTGYNLTCVVMTWTDRNFTDLVSYYAHFTAAQFRLAY